MKNILLVCLAFGLTNCSQPEARCQATFLKTGDVNPTNPKGGTTPAAGTGTGTTVGTQPPVVVPPVVVPPVVTPPLVLVNPLVGKWSTCEPMSIEEGDSPLNPKSSKTTLSIKDDKSLETIVSHFTDKLCKVPFDAAAGAALLASLKEVITESPDAEEGIKDYIKDLVEGAKTASNFVAGTINDKGVGEFDITFDGLTHYLAYKVEMSKLTVTSPCEIVPETIADEEVKEPEAPTTVCGFTKANRALDFAGALIFNKE